MKEKLKNSIKPLVKIFCFTFIFIFVFIYLSYLMKPNEVTLQNISGYYGEKKNTLDMVYIGGSACFVYWTPLQAFEEKGFTSYSYGSYVVQAELYKYLIKEALKTQKPKLIVIDARAFQYREARLPEEVHYRNFLTGMSFSKNKLEFIKENVRKNLDMDELPFIFDIIKYHRSFSENINEDALKMMFHKYKNPNKGFHFVPEVEKLERYNFQTTKKKKIAKETEDILLDLIDYMKTTKDIEYLFVVSPYQEKQEHKEQFNYIQDIVIKEGYKFIDVNDYYDEMALNFEGDLYNFNHVNIYGAEKYTRFLSEYIEKNYKLDDHRKDDKYIEWNNLLSSWHEKVAVTKKEIDEKKKAW